MPAANRLVFALGLVAAGLAPAVATAQDDEFDRTPVDCISVSAIDRTHVIDDRTILFYMRGKKIYRNYLPRNCPGLERQDRFSYQPANNRLCDIDVVTVLEHWGGRLHAGFTCPLGAFHPIPLEEAEELELAEDGELDRDSVVVEEVEPPEDSAAEPAAEAAGQPEE